MTSIFIAVLKIQRRLFQKCSGQYWEIQILRLFEPLCSWKKFIYEQPTAEAVNKQRVSWVANRFMDSINGCGQAIEDTRISHIDVRTKKRHFVVAVDVVVIPNLIRSKELTKSHWTRYRDIKKCSPTNEPNETRPKKKLLCSSDARAFVREQTTNCTLCVHPAIVILSFTFSPHVLSIATLMSRARAPRYARSHVMIRNGSFSGPRFQKWDDATKRDALSFGEALHTLNATAFNGKFIYSTVVIFCMFGLCVCAESRSTWTDLYSLPRRSQLKIRNYKHFACYQSSFDGMGSVLFVFLRASHTSIIHNSGGVFGV